MDNHDTHDNHDDCNWYFGVPFKSKRKEAEMAAPQRKFKVGDRVRLNKDKGGGRYGHKGDTGRIDDMDSPSSALVEFDTFSFMDSSKWFVAYADLELLPHYARGTRIKLLRDHGVYKAGHRGTVTYENDENVGALMDIGRYAAFPHDVVGVADDSAPDCAERKGERGNPKPKFKAGDVVTYISDKRARLTIARYKEMYGNPAYEYVEGGFDYEDILELVTPAPCPQDNEHGWSLKSADGSFTLTADRFTIALPQQQPCIVALINKDGKPRPSQWPHVHPDSASATAEAERLAKINPGQEFAVFQRVAGRVCETTYNMKEVA